MIGTSAQSSVPARTAKVRVGVACVRAALRGVPRAAWICALVAALNCAAWSLITPPFQVPDEAEHYAYVERIAQTGTPPSPERPASYSAAQNAVLKALMTEAIKFRAKNGSIWSAVEQARLERVLENNDRSGANPRLSDSHPPLYYAVETIPYSIGKSGSVLDSMMLMRLFSALLGGITVLFVFLFLREALPARPWGWTVGALAAAFQPLFAFISGGINPDAGLFAAVAGLFYCFARAFRRGLTTSLAVAIGAVLAAGYLVKLNFLGLIPGAVVGLLVLSWREKETRSWRALRPAGVAIAVAAAPILLGVLMNLVVWNRPAIGATHEAFEPANVDSSISEAISYIWQFYFVRLPGMAQNLPLDFALRDYWLTGFVGKFGWIDTLFSPWVYDVATGVVVVLLVLVVVALLRGRHELRARLSELGVYAVMAAGLMLLVGITSYNLYARDLGGTLQARYLLPLLPLYGGAIALATRAAGARWMPVIGVLIVMVALAHNLFSQLLVIARYYS